MTETISNIKVYVTCDYGRFKKLLGNREVTSSRLNAIKESMRYDDFCSYGVKKGADDDMY